ncbi:hypothetical protein T11_17833 [Trichinella zimbabwensis]|uniref:Uncharacterized protein n=1 Tax=Trichinella zimbabwensis TaxID=268475 RepID=A0A0V1GB93_9BILA|nr:hypothetical protein T11_17833 [Trichinella zimbabwensis]
MDDKPMLTESCNIILIRIAEVKLSFYFENNRDLQFSYR